MSDPCYEGWSEEGGNKSGTCCCNCRYQQPIVGHPWNKAHFTKTSIMSIIGYGCHMPESDRIVFFDQKHGMCEMHAYKDNVVQLKVVK